MEIFKPLILFTLLVLVTTIASADPPEEPETGLSDEDKEARNEELKNAAFQLAAVVAALLSVSNPVSAAVVAIGSIAFAALLKDYPMGKGDVWDSLEDRIDIKIGEKMASSKVHDLKEQVLYPINRRILKDKRFTPEDLEEILDRMPMVVPSNKEIGWNYDLPLAMVYYLPYMIAGYHKVIADGLQPTCALANDMQTFRTKVITGCKEMMRKRYKSIHSKMYASDRVNYKKHNITKRGGRLGFGSGEKVRVSIDRLMTYEDTVTKSEFTLRLRSGQWHGKSWDQAINKIRDDTVNYLFKEVVEKINAFFIPKLCLENLGCACPKAITKEEINFSYPRNCYGNAKCVHPAGKFDNWSYYWCYTARRTNADYLKTNKINFDSCMPVQEQYIEPLNILD